MTEEELSEIEQLRARHLDAVDNLRNSFQYRLGDTLVRALSTREGAIAAPKALYGLAREAVRYRRMLRGPASTGLGTAQIGHPATGLVVGCVLDEFSMLCLSREWILVPLESEAEPGRELDLIFCETAWRGNHGHWRGALSQPRSARAKELERIVRSGAAPTILWNKEDPVHFDTFNSAAGWFDVIATTAKEMVPKYERQFPNKRVVCMPFAAQPDLHNPVGSILEDAERIVFAGSWRGDRYQERSRSLGGILRAAAHTQRLDIYDRFMGEDNRQLRFPSEFDRSVRPPVPYGQMAGTYKSALAVVNANTVVESSSMMSRRVFEVLASRVPLVSAPSRAIDELLGDCGVLVARNEREAARHFERLISEPSFRSRVAHVGYREVHKNHTYRHRFESVLRPLGIRQESKHRVDNVTIVLVSNRPENLDHALQSVASQSWVDKELIFVANSDRFDLACVGARVEEMGGRLLVVDERATLAECLNDAISECDTRYVAKFDDDDHYGRDYLTDQMIALRYSGAAVVGKHSHFVNFESDSSTWLRFPGWEFRYVSKVQGGTLVVDRDQTRGISFRPVERGTDTLFFERCGGLGPVNFFV